MEKQTDKQKERLNEELEEWKLKYDNILTLDSLDKTKTRGRNTYRDKREKLIYETYIIKEGKETIFSGGMMLWLFIKLLDKKKPKSYGQVLEELKINHRLKLFKIDINELEEGKIRAFMLKQ
jgi:hypothetical protein